MLENSQTTWKQPMKLRLMDHILLIHFLFQIFIETAHPSNDKLNFAFLDP